MAIDALLITVANYRTETVHPGDLLGVFLLYIHPIVTCPIPCSQQISKLTTVQVMSRFSQGFRSNKKKGRPSLLELKGTVSFFPPNTGVSIQRQVHLKTHSSE